MNYEYLEWLKSLIAKDTLIPFYKSKQWRLVRHEALERDNYECVMCKEAGKYAKCQNVHHIKELKDRPDKALDLDNLMCVCIKCHNYIHDRYQTKAETNKKLIESFNNFDAEEGW